MIAAAAPHARASGTKRWPSVCAPPKAKKTSPPRTARESIAAPSIMASGSPAVTRPPTARAASPTDSRAKALLQSLADLLQVGERQFLSSDRLLPLVPLAGHHHRPAGLGGGDRLADRLAPVRHQAVGA